MSNTTQTRVCDLGISLGGDGVCLFECFHLFQALRRVYLKYVNISCQLSTHCLCVVLSGAALELGLGQLEL